MGNADRIIRLLIAIIFVSLYFMNVVSGTLGVVLLVLAAIFVLTSITNFCPIYRIFGISSCPIKKQ